MTQVGDRGHTGGPFRSSSLRPVIGYFLTVPTTGRRSGVARRTPLSYAILDGHAYLLPDSARALVRCHGQGP